MKKISIIILTLILSVSFISCSRADDTTNINDGYSMLISNTKWVNEEAHHIIQFGTPVISSLTDGTFSDGKYSGIYKIYENEYANDFVDKFENCDQNIKDTFWNNVKDKDNYHLFGLIVLMNGNENTRFEYFGCLDGNNMILCDYKKTYVYTKDKSNQDNLIEELHITEETANNILNKINLMLTLDYYDIINISENPEYGYILEVDVLSTDKYFIYLSEEYDIMLISKDKLESKGGEIIFRQKE